MKITIENLCYSYPDNAVLHGVHLETADSEIVCIVGQNGSGKSTLVKCIDGLQTPKTGRILFNGTDAAQLSRLDIAKMIGYVPQSSQSLFSVSVFDTVLMGRKPHYSWHCSDVDVDIVCDILQMMELDHLALQDFNTLSGGQKQRVLIARAIAQEPQLLLLDEPTSALDIAHQLEVMEIIHTLMKQRTMSVIMVIHDLNLASRYADMIVMLKNGRVYATGTPEETLTVENIEVVYDVHAHVARHNDMLAITPLYRVRDPR